MAESSNETLSTAEARSRLDLFTGSREFKLLRCCGLKILGRRKPLDPSDWHDAFLSEAWNNPRYMKWRERLRAEALKAGVPEWIAEPACLVEGIDTGLLVMTPSWPIMKIVVPDGDRGFLGSLLYRSHRVGMSKNLNIRIAFRDGDLERGVFAPAGVLPRPGSASETETDLPDIADLSVHLSFPPSTPSDEIVRFARRSREAAREVLRRIGYAVPRSERGNHRGRAIPPTVRVVSITDDPEILGRLVGAAARVGSEHALDIGIAVETGNEGQRIVGPDDVPPASESALDPEARPPRETALSVHVWFTPLVPSSEIVSVVRRSLQAGRELLRKLGYRVPVRERSSRKAGSARDLQLHRRRLPPRGTGDVLEKLIGEEEFDQLSDQERRRRTGNIRSDRHRMAERSRRYS